MNRYRVDMTRKAIIFDIDGTLANCEHRRHFVIGKKKYFDKFHDAMGADTINEEIRDLCNMYYGCHYYIIICTGRPNAYREITERWLEKNKVPYDELKMRPDTRRNDADVDVKQDMLNEISKNKNVVVAVDDRNRVVDMWRRNGVTCLQVAEGNF